MADPEAKKGLNISTFASPIISCLEDQNTKVCNGATALLPTIIQSIGIDSPLEESSNLKPVSQNKVIQMMESCRIAAPVKAPAPKGLPGRIGSKVPPQQATTK